MSDRGRPVVRGRVASPAPRPTQSGFGPPPVAPPVSPLQPDQVQERAAKPPVAPSAGKPRLSTFAVRCETPFDRQPRDVILVSCADGRFSIEDERTLAELGVQKTPDRYSPPGGPGALHLLTCAQAMARDVDLGRLRFLIEHHHTKRVLLVAHEDCAFYAKKFEHYSSEDQRRARQLADIIDVARDLRKEFPGVEFDCFYVGEVSECGALTIRRVET